MSRFDRTAHINEETQARTDIELMPSRMLEQCLALNQLQGDVRSSSVGYASLDQSRDSGMTQLPERTPFIAEAAAFVVCVQVVAQHFECDVLDDIVLRALSTKHD
jgi:hypothetical protein